MQNEKRLTLPEAEAIAQAGMSVGTVYEDAPSSIEYFSFSRGHLDGVNACHYARELAQPPGSAIYFAVDYDATFSHISGSIFDYFRGVDQGMRDAGGLSAYAIGVYGSGAACTWLKAHCPFVKFGWLAESGGWLGSRNFRGWDVKQSVAAGSLAGFSSQEYEDCIAGGDFGAFAPAHMSVLADGAAPLEVSVERSVKDQIISKLGDEWNFFGRQTMNLAGAITRPGHKEAEPGYFERVGKYWHEGVGENLDGRDDVPWSAAFVSWIMRTAGAGNRFNYASAHCTYIRQAIADRINHNASSSFVGFRLSEYKPQSGDLVGRARQPGIDYDHQGTGGYMSHCDIVVEVRPTEIDVIGGNVGNSVTKRTLSLDHDGFLAPDNTHCFVVIQNRLP